MKVIHDYLVPAALVGSLMAFFTYSANKWIVGMEKQVNDTRLELKEVRHEAAIKNEKLARMDAVVQEIRDQLKIIIQKIDQQGKR